MKVYVLIYKVGISSGYHELIGIYDSMEALERGREQDKKEYYCCRISGDYEIEEIDVNKNINDVFLEW